MTEPQLPDISEPQRSSRDLAQVRGQLETWLAGRLAVGAAPSVQDLEATSTNGMSSETLLFQADWADTGRRHNERLVARVAPDPVDEPVFPTYDLERQFRVISLVGQLTQVPVPRVWWSESDPSVIGAPFFVMERIDGQVPPDIMPYSLGGNWLYDADPLDQRRLEEATVGVLADLHRIDRPGETFAFLAFEEPGDTALRSHVAHTGAWYEYAARGCGRSPLVERAFAWLDEHRPAEEGATVLSWGDSRIGNILYQDFLPAAVLDWEMAGLGPRELDVIWLLYGHRVFEDIAAEYGLPGMPHFLRLDEVASFYEKLTGYALRDVEFYMTYAAIQWAIVFLRTGHRAVHFGEQAMPDDVDELIHNLESLTRMLSGDYWR